MKDLKIIPIDIAAANTLSELEVLCFPNDPWSYSMICDSLSNNAVSAFAAVSCSSILAYVFTSQVADEGEILNIAVVPDARRRGIGKALLSFAIDHLKSQSCGSIFLEVRESNIAAIKLYANFGFRKLGVRKNYYESPRENAIIMGMFENPTDQ